MKKHLLPLAIAAIFSVSAANAGNLSDPVVTPTVVAQDAVSTSDDDMQMTLAILTLGFFITLGMAN